MTAQHKIVYLDCEKFLPELLDYSQAYHVVESGAKHDPISQSKAFAFFWMIREAGALGKNPQDALNDPALAVELQGRLTRWFAARMDWIALLHQKECPAALDETATQRSRDAARFGVLLGNKDRRAAALANPLIP
jgi:hypothetical protein